MVADVYAMHNMHSQAIMRLCVEIIRRNQECIYLRSTQFPMSLFYIV